MMDIRNLTKKLPFAFEPVTTSQLPKLDFDNIPFGKIFGDHMFIAVYKDGQWEKPTIQPYGPLPFSPAMSALNYGQAIFEGLKAYRSPTGTIHTFRLEENHKRMNLSAARLCMPEIPTEYFVEGVKALADTDRGWIPPHDKGALYFRPVMFGTDEFIGVRASGSYMFAIISCPVGAYYSKPVKLLTTKDYTRAATGGTGNAKAAGNYAAAMLPDKLAKDQGYDNILWLDGKESTYIEECGTMNVFFALKGKRIWTPNLTGTILPGITRRSVIQLLEENGYTVEQRRISIQEIQSAYYQGELLEAFGAGTAAGIAQVSLIGYAGADMVLQPIEDREVGPWLLETITGLRHGIIEDTHGWVDTIG